MSKSLSTTPRFKMWTLFFLVVLFLGMFSLWQNARPFMKFYIQEATKTTDSFLTFASPTSLRGASILSRDDDITNTKAFGGPGAYLKLARSGPRRCVTANCYIVDVVADPYQPRIFLSMLGLPASDIGREKSAGLMNISFVDVRTGKYHVQTQSHSLTNNKGEFLVNSTHSYALLLQAGTGNRGDNQTQVTALCINLNHHGNTALWSYYESMTWACDLPPRVRELDGFIKRDWKLRVDVLIAPKDWAASGGTGEAPHYLILNSVDNPFYMSHKKEAVITSGLFNSVTRRASNVPEPFAWRTGAFEFDEKGAAKRKPSMSACVLGVNYNSAQHREVVQYYISSGFDHVYLGVPQWPTTALFNTTWHLLGDFVNDGKLSIIVSEYAGEYIQPDKFLKKITYGASSHKSSFLNTCLLVARASGDDLVSVNDFDELIEYNHGNKTSALDALIDHLSIEKISLQDTCSINLRSVSGIFTPEKAGFNFTGRIKDRLAGIVQGNDSVNTYGKSIHNAKRVLRAGVHGAAYCEANPGPELSHNSTRPSVSHVDHEVKPDREIIRTLHMTDSYKQRSAKWQLKLALESHNSSYYARDWAGLVSSHLDKRVKIER